MFRNNPRWPNYADYSPQNVHHTLGDNLRGEERTILQTGYLPLSFISLYKIHGENSQKIKLQFGSRFDIGQTRSTDRPSVRVKP